MSTAVAGVVEKVSFNENKNGPDKFDNTHRVGVCIGGVWYNFGATRDKGRGLAVNVKEGQGWHAVQQGDELQFFAESREYNGKTYWDKKGPAQVVKKGAGTVTPSAPAAQAPAKSGPAPTGRNGMRDGMIVNNVTALIAAGVYSDAEYAKAVQTVLKVVKAVESDGVDVEEAPKKAAPAPEKASPTVEKAPEPDSQDDFDDDIPF